MITAFAARSEIDDGASKGALRNNRDRNHKLYGLQELEMLKVASGIKTTELAAEIVAAFVSNNSLPVAELPGLIASVDAALRSLVAGSSPEAEPVEKPAPAVPIRRSVTPDYLICLDDGMRLKSLKRHLTALGMTPDDYRKKWGLPADYPMAAPNYAAKRSALAKSFGLGLPRKEAVENPVRAQTIASA